MSPEVTSALLRAIYQATGLTTPPPFADEVLEILQRETQPDGSERLHFRYHFDEDRFSQYDQTVIFNGWLTWQAGQACVTELLIEHRGEAAHYILPK